MKTEVKHTPTPTKIEAEPKVSIKGVRGHNFYVRYSDGSRVLCPSKAIAEGIFCAVNAHDELVAAAKAMDALFDLSHVPMGYEYPKETQIALNALRAALAKAERS